MTIRPGNELHSQRDFYVDFLSTDAGKLMSERLKNFIGNVEANEIFSGKCDCIISDGFVGNIAIKLSEGLMESAATLLRREIKKSLAGLGELTPLQVKQVENLTLSITEKIINDPIIVLKGKANRPSRDSYLDMTRRLFKLDTDNGEGDQNEY